MMMCIINVEEPRISLCILHTNYDNTQAVRKFTSCFSDNKLMWNNEKEGVSYQCSSHVQPLASIRGRGFINHMFCLQNNDVYYLSQTHSALSITDSIMILSNPDPSFLDFTYLVSNQCPLAINDRVSFHQVDSSSLSLSSVHDTNKLCRRSALLLTSIVHRYQYNSGHYNLSISLHEGSEHVHHTSDNMRSCLFAPLCTSRYIVMLAAHIAFLAPSPLHLDNWTNR